MNDSHSKVIAFVSNSVSTALLFRKELLITLLAEGYRVIFYANCDDLDAFNQLQDLGIDVREFSLSRSAKNIFGDFAATVRLARSLKSINPYAVVSTFIKPVIFGSFAARYARVRNIYSMIEGMGYVFTDDGASSQKLGRQSLKILLKTLLKIALSFCTKIFVLNFDDLREVASLTGFTENRIKYIDGIGVNLEAYPPTPPELSSISFLFVGRLLKEKGIEEFLGAAITLKEKYPEITWEILGASDDNPGSISLERLNSLQNDGVIKWHGTSREVFSFLRKCAVFVLPSYREGKPRSVMEAMAVGRPVITTDAPGCREMVTPGENGYLIPVQNIDALVVAMERFISDKDLIEEMGRVSSEIAKERFNVHKINRILMSEMNL